MEAIDPKHKHKQYDVIIRNNEVFYYNTPSLYNIITHYIRTLQLIINTLEQCPLTVSDNLPLALIQLNFVF